MNIDKIIAREILDSRGNPTVECDLFCGPEIFRASAPSGASTGKYEAMELRDQDSRYLGKGVLKAVANINEKIAPALIGMDTRDQARIDQTMQDLDGTENKNKLGANAILAVSMAACRAGAKSKNIPLYRHIAQLAGNDRLIMPVPSFNVINGGKHAGNQLPMQEFMIMPIGAQNFTEALRWGAEIYHNLKKIIKDEYGQNAINVGDEGGFAPDIARAEDALNLIIAAIEKSGYADKVKIAMDIAASEFFCEGIYDLDFKAAEKKLNGKRDGIKMVDYYQKLCQLYPIISLEDPFDQDDWQHYAKLISGVGDKIQIVGDDLLVTNPARIKIGIEKKAVNALLLKLNQIGTVSEAIAACKTAQEAGWGVMVSHRSGETEDNFIADLAVGLKAGQIKTGAPCRSERLAKYNQLLRIEEELGQEAEYAGKNFRKP